MNDKSASDPIISVASSASGVNADKDQQGQSRTGDELRERHLRREDDPFLIPLSSSSQDEGDVSSSVKDKQSLTSSGVDISSRLADAIEAEIEREIIADIIREQERVMSLEEDDDSYVNTKNSLNDDRIRVTSQRPRILVVPQSSPKERLSSNSRSSSLKSYPRSHFSGVKMTSSNPEERAIHESPKRALECLRRCIAEGHLHPVQCHSIC
jgi:hypothetical protein